jgi:hypothetical protein
MAIEKDHQRDVGGIFLSADVPGPTFRGPIPFDELKTLSEQSDFVRLSKSIVYGMNVRADGTRSAA